MLTISIHQTLSPSASIAHRCISESRIPIEIGSTLPIHHPLPRIELLQVSGALGAQRRLAPWPASFQRYESRSNPLARDCIANVTIKQNLYDLLGTESECSDNAVDHEHTTELIHHTGNDPDQDDDREPEPPTQAVDKPPQRSGKRNAGGDAPAGRGGARGRGPLRGGSGSAVTGNEQGMFHQLSNPISERCAY